MRSRALRCTVIAILLAVGVSSCARPEAEFGAFSAQDAAAVRANLAAYLSADPIDDPETFFSQFTDDVYWVYSDQPPWVGMEALRAVAWCQTLAGSEITADRVEGAGDLAYARGTYRLSLGCGGDSPSNSQGVFLSAHRRQADGSWRIESLLQRE